MVAERLRSRHNINDMPHNVDKTQVKFQECSFDCPPMR